MQNSVQHYEFRENQFREYHTFFADVSETAYTYVP